MNFILDNLEESIVIFSPDRIEFINDTFIDLFKSFFSEEFKQSKLEKPAAKRDFSFFKQVKAFFR